MAQQLLATLFVAATLVGGLLVLLRALKALGEHLSRSDDAAPARVRPLLPPDSGWLSDEERAIDEANRRDLERIAAACRVFEHGMNRLFERTLAQLLDDQHDRNWARVASGDYPLVGVQR